MKSSISSGTSFLFLLLNPVIPRLHSHQFVHTTDTHVFCRERNMIWRKRNPRHRVENPSWRFLNFKRWTRLWARTYVAFEWILEFYHPLISFPRIHMIHKHPDTIGVGTRVPSWNSVETQGSNTSSNIFLSRSARTESFTSCGTAQTEYIQTQHRQRYGRSGAPTFHSDWPRGKWGGI